jgi:hypothetical protein
MSSKTLTAATFAGALAFVAEGVVQLAHTQAEHFTVAGDYLIEGLFAAGLLLTMAGLLGLQLRQEAGAGRLASVGFSMAMVGQGVHGAVAVATAIHGQDVLGPLVPVAMLVWLSGLVCFAIGTFRARILPRWAGPLLPLSLLAGIAAGPAGPIVLGVAWLAEAALVLTDRYELRPALS